MYIYIEILMFQCRSVTYFCRKLLLTFFYERKEILHKIHSWKPFFYIYIIHTPLLEFCSAYLEVLLYELIYNQFRILLEKCALCTKFNLYFGS